MVVHCLGDFLSPPFCPFCGKRTREVRFVQMSLKLEKARSRPAVESITRRFGSDSYHSDSSTHDSAIVD